MERSGDGASCAGMPGLQPQLGANQPISSTQCVHTSMRGVCFIMRRSLNRILFPSLPNEPHCELLAGLCRLKWLP